MVYQFSSSGKPCLEFNIYCSKQICRVDIQYFFKSLLFLQENFIIYLFYKKRVKTNKREFKLTNYTLAKKADKETKFDSQ